MSTLELVDIAAEMQIRYSSEGCGMTNAFRMIVVTHSQL